MPLTARPSAPAVPSPQIQSNAALTSLSVPVLASVVGDVYVRHTHPLPAFAACRVCVRSGPPRARAAMCPPCL
eukprot:scaffold28260_cov70-Isochrysis_galbana.AAC.1